MLKKFPEKIVPIELDDVTGDLFITIPEDILNELSWEEGTVVQWDVTKEGDIMLREVDEDF